MAIDTENKRRSATGINNIFVIYPIADGSIDSADRIQSSYIYSGIDIALGGLIIAASDILSIEVIQDILSILISQDVLTTTVEDLNTSIEIRSYD